MPKNMLSEAQNKYWYGRGQYVAEYDHTLTEAHVLSNESFSAGARWAIRESSELSPHISKFIEMMCLLGFLEPQDDESDSMVQASSDGTEGSREDAATGAGPKNER